MTYIELCLSCINKTVLLLLVANGAPVLARHWLKDRFRLPVDMGLKLSDGRALFGYSKTWRGIIASAIVTSLVAAVLGMPALDGAVFGLAAMSGDLLASFIKRRQGYAESSRVRSIDTIPESIMPALALHEQLGLNVTDILAVAFTFFLLDVFLSPVLYRLHIKNRPY
ncbi:CDP-archaeol synthase [Methylobacter sp. YRD-M1]|uniref:CDP-archaeol synthase n=1 Tax=Methylobacter sp. YRD-M1 TaxID=2911520 RepID=UPI00227AFC43|nr:CDP-archaeol synthase [Methylobacter sp. YRD-M1]WAK00233.1 CDP-archaeol synthase [Methylobacter sp. YRD-M1]